MTNTGCLLLLCDVWLFENSWKSTIVDKLLQKFKGILFIYRGLTLIYSSFLACGLKKSAYGQKIPMITCLYATNYRLSFYQTQGTTEMNGR